jgi:hypothetical protein
MIGATQMVVMPPLTIPMFRFECHVGLFQGSA